MKPIAYRKEEQAYGEFDGGQITENKPIGFPQDAGRQRPYSNLFYWAHAVSREGGTIGLHPHQGFEIISVVLKGEIEHYDTAHKVWKKLSAGDIQIIRSGNGISHSEKLLPGSEIFQIWFDPDLSLSLKKDASYNDYASEVFPLTGKNGMQVKTFKGNGSPLMMDADVGISEFLVPIGEFSLEARTGTLYSFYLIEGGLSVNGEKLEKDGFAIVTEAEEIRIAASAESRLFLIENPVEPGYATYSQRYSR